MKNTTRLRDGLFDKLGHLNNFRETKYAAPLKEQQYLDKLQDEVATSLAMVETQRQAQQDLVQAETYVPQEIPSNVSSFEAANAKQNAQAEMEAKKQVENINKLGFDVTLFEFKHSDGAKSFEVEAKMPEKYKDRDPLTMPEGQLKDAQEEAKEERSGSKAPGVSFKPVDMEKFVAGLGRGGAAVAA